MLAKLRQPVSPVGPGTVEYVGLTVQDGDLANPQTLDGAEVWFPPAALFTPAMFCSTTSFFFLWPTRPLVDGDVEVVDALR